MGSPTRQLFGTDGIRGIAGEFPLTMESTYLIGRALGHDLIRTAANPRVVIGQDTRESSAWIADRVMLGLVSAGVEAPELFRTCGIQATFINAAPDGRNINENCGALHPEMVARALTERGQFDLGVTFDGDADRALFSDAAGRVVDGDGVLLLAARDMKSRGVLKW